MCGVAARGALALKNLGSCARTSRLHRTCYYARKGGFAIRTLNSEDPCVLWWVERVPVRISQKRRCKVYLGGGGLLIVLGIIALVLGWTVIGIILIILGLFGGGFGFYNSRRGS